MNKANKKSKTPPATKRMAREISAEEIKQVSGGTGRSTGSVQWPFVPKIGNTPPPAPAK